MIANATNGQAAPTVRLANCRHGFGEAMRFDAIVDGVYPDRSASLWLSQGGDRWTNVYVAIPYATIECAKVVAAAITRYHVGNACRTAAPVDVQLCWEGAPDVSWQIEI